MNNQPDQEDQEYTSPKGVVTKLKPWEAQKLNHALALNGQTSRYTQVPGQSK